jgi:hypothetical protein
MTSHTGPMSDSPMVPSASWGSWSFNPRALTLDFVRDGLPRHSIQLRGITSSACIAGCDFRSEEQVLGQKRSDWRPRHSASGSVRSSHEPLRWRKGPQFRSPLTSCDDAHSVARPISRVYVLIYARLRRNRRPRPRKLAPTTARYAGSGVTAASVVAPISTVNAARNARENT